ncbi:hypothetical protein [Mesorhizobium sp. CAU 1741]|uniref:hypothetical protein n=1 Tax=Mesorhizobium sp. CAU 1741 TaxID=3140366 RepID=UPI00325B2E37
MLLAPVPISASGDIWLSWHAVERRDRVYSCLPDAVNEGCENFEPLVKETGQESGHPKVAADF